jgi:hypothetical protein
MAAPDALSARVYKRVASFTSVGSDDAQNGNAGLASVTALSS